MKNIQGFNQPHRTLIVRQNLTTHPLNKSFVSFIILSLHIFIQYIKIKIESISPIFTSAWPQKQKTISEIHINLPENPHNNVCATLGSQSSCRFIFECLHLRKYKMQTVVF